MIETNIANKVFICFTAKQKAVWTLVMREGRTEKEAATILGITRDAVHDRLNKARKKFTKLSRAYRKGVSL